MKYVVARADTDEKLQRIHLTSSVQDEIDISVQDGRFVDNKTSEEVSGDLMSKLKFDKGILIQGMEAVSELIRENKFVSSIQQLDKKINQQILEKKRLLLESRSVILRHQPCSEGYDVCLGDTKYDWTQTLACSLSHDTLGGNCSNRYCIGYCQNLGCDCICGVGSYGCFCTAKGRYCTGFWE